MMPPQTLKVNKCCLMTSNTMIPGMCVMGKYTLEDVTTKVFVTHTHFLLSLNPTECHSIPHVILFQYHQWCYGLSGSSATSKKFPMVHVGIPGTIIGLFFTV